MKKYYPIKLDKGEFKLDAEKTSPEINPTSNPVGLVLAGGGVTVKRLEVTENGTYTAPTGEAYSPVVVSVAGGGSSDFSTANVTVSDIDRLYGAFVSVDNEWTTGDNKKLPTVHGSGVYTLILYKNKAHIMVEKPEGAEVAVSGNIEQYEASDNEFIVTGDCTINFSHQ